MWGVEKKEWEDFFLFFSFFFFFLFFFFFFFYSHLSSFRSSSKTWFVHVVALTIRARGALSVQSESPRLPVE